MVFSFSLSEEGASTPAGRTVPAGPNGSNLLKNAPWWPAKGRSRNKASPGLVGRYPTNLTMFMKRGPPSPPSIGCQSAGAALTTDSGSESSSP